MWENNCHFFLFFRACFVFFGELLFKANTIIIHLQAAALLAYMQKNELPPVSIFTTVSVWLEREFGAN